jgi:glycosyltransferase involved in cell wall biosynthesis
MTEENKFPLVSIVMPCFNHEQFVTETIDSIKGQSYANWECIIVDNGSTDRSAEIIKSVIANDKRFQFIQQENKGVSSARNRAIHTSKGKYILPLDSDDKIHMEYVAEAVKVLESSDNIDIVYSEAELFGEKKGKWNLNPFSMEQMLFENVIFVTALYRRSKYDMTPGYNEQMQNGFEDWDFWLSMLEAGARVHKMPFIYFYYRIRSTSRNNSLDINKQRELRRIIFNNHKELYLKNLNFPELVFDNLQLEKAKHQFINSYEYKIGSFLLKPLRFLKSKF